MIQNETSEKRDIDPAVIDRKETWRKYERIQRMQGDFHSFDRFKS